MSKQLYVPYFSINPYGAHVPGRALEAARKELETQLGCAWQVLDAKAAFEDAGGLHAYWRGASSPAILRWTSAIHAAALAAYQVEPPMQAAIADLELLEEACVDVIAATRYAYTSAEWLTVFTAHFGMSDYCESHQEALAAGHHWLAIANQACPIAAADQEIRCRCRGGRAPALSIADESTVHAGLNLSSTISGNHGARTCF